MRGVMERVLVTLTLLSLVTGCGGTLKMEVVSTPTPESGQPAGLEATLQARTPQGIETPRVRPPSEEPMVTLSPGTGAEETPAPWTLETATSPAMPTPQVCDQESEPFWHWQMGRLDKIKDFFFPTSSTGLAVGEPSYLLRTDDGGSSWRVWPIDDPHGLNTILFISEQVGWVAGNQGTILKTADGGFAWQHQQTGTQADLYTLEFLNGQTGWAGGSHGTVLRTSDGGETWSASATGPAIDVTDLSFVDAMNGYATGMVNAGPESYVLRTSDGGVTWENTQHWGTGTEAVFAAVGMPVWVAGGWVGGTVWKGLGHSSDTEVISNMGHGHFREILFADEDRGWIVGDNGLAISTDNGGEYWQSMPLLEHTDWQMVRVTPGGDVLVAGTSLEGIQVARSTDGGVNWTAVPPSGAPTSGLNASSVDFVDAWYGWALVADTAPSGSPRLLAITHDGGHSWDLREALGGAARRIQFVDRLRGWAIGDSGLVARTDDGGLSWDVQSISFPEEFYALSFADREHGWVLSDEDGPGTCAGIGSLSETTITLFRTDAGGDDWGEPVCIQFPGSGSSFRAGRPSLQFVNQDTGWIVDREGTILKSVDGGLTWETQANGPGMELTDLQMLDEHTGWITGEGGVLLATSDGGEQWTQQRVGDRKLTSVRFLDARKGWVVATDSWYETSDGGQTWDRSSLEVWGGGTLDVVDQDHVWLGMDTLGIRAYAPVCLDRR